MATINNSEITKGLVDTAKIQINVDKVPSQLAEKVVPVIVANPIKIMKIISKGASDDNSDLIMTTHAIKDTWLYGMQISLSKDVVNDSTFTTITATPSGDIARPFITMRYEPLTAASNMSQDFMLPIPILLAKNSSITMANETATASIDVTTKLWYAETD